MIDCLPPGRRDQLLINAQLPSNQAQACSAGIVEFRENVEHELQRDRAQHHKSARGCAWPGVIAQLSSVPPKLATSFIALKLPKAHKGCPSRSGVCSVRPPASRALTGETFPTRVLGNQPAIAPYEVDPEPPIATATGPREEAKALSMALAETQRLRMLEQLRHAGQPARNARRVARRRDPLSRRRHRRARAQRVCRSSASTSTTSRSASAYSRPTPLNHADAGVSVGADARDSQQRHQRVRLRSPTKPPWQSAVGRPPPSRRPEALTRS